MFTDVCSVCSHATEAHGIDGCGHCSCGEERLVVDPKANGLIQHVKIDAPPAKAQGGGMTA